MAWWGCRRYRILSHIRHWGQGVPGAKAAGEPDITPERSMLSGAGVEGVIKSVNRCHFLLLILNSEYLK